MTTSEPDLRYVDHDGRRISWLDTAHVFWNGWLYEGEIKMLRDVGTQVEAEQLLREMQRRIDQRIEAWDMYE
jgi:hypothetical protein